jgi:hypothetical protein
MVDSSGKEEGKYETLVGLWKYNFFSLRRVPKSCFPIPFISNINEENLNEFIRTNDKTKVFLTSLNEEEKRICGGIEKP